jgi:hypothetical protein
MNKGFGYVIIVACLPAIVSAVLSAWISISTAHSTAVNEISVKCAVMDERISANKELFINRFEEAEKNRVLQYQYLVNETNEIKEQLKQKKNISQSFPEVDPNGIILVTRGRMITDSTRYFEHMGDSLYTELCLNLKCISSNL